MNYRSLMINLVNATLPMNQLMPIKDFLNAVMSLVNLINTEWLEKNLTQFT